MLVTALSDISRQGNGRYITRVLVIVRSRFWADTTTKQCSTKGNLRRKELTAPFFSRKSQKNGWSLYFHTTEQSDRRLSRSVGRRLLDQMLDILV